MVTGVCIVLRNEVDVDRSFVVPHMSVVVIATMRGYIELHGAKTVMTPGAVTQLLHLRLLIATR